MLSLVLLAAFAFAPMRIKLPIAIAALAGILVISGGHLSHW